MVKQFPLHVKGETAGQLPAVRYDLGVEKVIAEEPLLVDLHARIRDVRIGPEGAVYVPTDNGRLLKLTPK
jgi:aldose sugar dehydrogenase